LRDLFNDVAPEFGHNTTTTIGVRRGVAQKDDYNVPIEGNGRQTRAEMH
jgi:hypothetical protein